METSQEKPKSITEQAVERIAHFNREIFGAEVVIIDATGTVPHEVKTPEDPSPQAA
jgi:hypothetical protein